MSGPAADLVSELGLHLAAMPLRYSYDQRQPEPGAGLPHDQASLAPAQQHAGHDVAGVSRCQRAVLRAGAARAIPGSRKVKLMRCVRRRRLCVL